MLMEGFLVARHIRHFSNTAKMRAMQSVAAREAAGQSASPLQVVKGAEEYEAGLGSLETGIADRPISAAVVRHRGEAEARRETLGTPKPERQGRMPSQNSGMRARPFRIPQSSAKPKGGSRHCFFCGSTEHTLRDCAKWREFCKRNL